MSLYPKMPKFLTDGKLRHSERNDFGNNRIHLGQFTARKDHGSLTTCAFPINRIVTTFGQNPVSAYYDSACRNISGHDCVSANGRPFADPDASQDLGAGANINPIIDLRRCSRQISSSECYLVANYDVFSDPGSTVDYNSQRMGQKYTRGQRSAYVTAKKIHEEPRDYGHSVSC